MTARVEDAVRCAAMSGADALKRTNIPVVGNDDDALPMDDRVVMRTGALVCVCVLMYVCMYVECTNVHICVCVCL